MPHPACVPRCTYMRTFPPTRAKARILTGSPLSRPRGTIGAPRTQTSPAHRRPVLRRPAGGRGGSCSSAAITGCALYLHVAAAVRLQAHPHVPTYRYRPRRYCPRGHPCPLGFANFQFAVGGAAELHAVCRDCTLFVGIHSIRSTPSRTLARA